MQLAFTYSLLALIAMAANIGAQYLVVRGYCGTYGDLLSMAVGTGVGLVVKYVLDKRYIFRFRARSAKHDCQIFALYFTVGLVTTCIFWAFELGFQQLFVVKEMSYLGAIIGLVIGYLSKYHLDMRFVFRRKGAFGGFGPRG